MANAEIISIGSELLLGQILDTNKQFLAQELALLGIDCFFQATVGDNKQRMTTCLKLALCRSDIVLTTGGLGPTADDLTIACIAELFGVSLISDAGTLAKIEHVYKQKGIPMPQSNAKQALYPAGSQVIPNPCGMACGIIFSLNEEALTRANINTVKPSKPERYLITFPGIPSEMMAMWHQTVKPFLAQTFRESVLWSCELKHYGIGESALAEKYNHLLGLINPTVAPLAGSGECRLRVTAKAATAKYAKELAEPVIAEIKATSGLLYYGQDEETLESVVGRLLVERNMTIATAESCTGGLVSKRLTDIPGSSKYVKAGIIAYANEIKQEILKVDDNILQTKGAVSAECASAMAYGIKNIMGADIGISVTGIAGPDGGTKEKPVGLVYIALAAHDFQTVARMTYSDYLSRSDIRWRSANDALNMVRLYLIAPDKLKAGYLK